MDLGYFAADTLGMPLYQIQSRLVGSDVRQMQLGPWQIDMSLQAESDILSGREVGFWLTVAKSIRLYVIIRDKECWLFVLNAAKLKTCGEQTGFSGETTKERIKEVKPAIVGVFHWEESKWTQVEYDGVSKGAN